MNNMMLKQKSLNKVILTCLIMLIVCGFSYDANGNQTTASNNFTITYNYLNQPHIGFEQWSGAVGDY